MRELPEIEPQEYEAALLEHEQRLYELTGGRSSFSESSPGVMLLELLTCIQLGQQGNMNRISGEALKNLCVLYGFTPEKPRPAEVHTAVMSDRPLPAGTKLRSEGMVFELAEDCPAGRSEACAYAKSADGRTELYQFDRGQPFSFEVFDGSDSLAIGFTQPFSAGEHSLLVCIDSAGRTLPEDMTGFETGTRIRWQYHGSEGGRTGWHDLEVISDGTHGFFCTGVVRFRLGGVHEKSGSVYPLRAEVVERGFDRLPRLCGAYPQHCRALQLDAKCRTAGFGLKAFSDNAMYFADPLAESGCTLLFVRTKEGWRTADSLGVAYETDPAESGMRLVTSSRAELKELFSGLPDKDGSVFMLVMYEQEAFRDACSLRSDGTAGQRLSTGFSGIFPERTAVLCGSGGVYSRWKLTESLESCSGGDEVFALEGGELVFGDNVHGKVPPCGEVLITSLALTSGAGGNIRPGGFSAEGFAAFRTEQAHGGADGERPEQTFARVISQPKEKTLLTPEDFIACARTTPGLLISGAQAFPTEDRDGAVQPNAVTVVIHPDVPEPHRDVKRLGWYINAARRRLERLCPITLALTVRFPEYIPVDIAISVRSGDYYRSAENAVRDFFGRYFSELRHEMDKGELLRAVSRLPGVTGVSGFTLRCSGGHAARRPDGGIYAPEWCRLYLRGLDVRCEE